jgi:hypothetical protein
MSLKGLIDNQTIIIDDHRRGMGEEKKWDDERTDIHIDKTTNYRLEGKRQKVRIRIPINSDRPLKIENQRGQYLEEIPRRMQKEISSAFEDTEVRERFMTDLIFVLKDFGSLLDSVEKLRVVFERLSKHFNLKWTEEKIIRYSQDVIKIYTELYRDEDGHSFFITVNRNRLKIGQKSGYARFAYTANNNYYR